VKVGGRYAVEEGKVEVDLIEPIGLPVPAAFVRVARYPDP
jgi:hypothetical protein